MNCVKSFSFSGQNFRGYSKWTSCPTEEVSEFWKCVNLDRWKYAW